MKNRVGRVIIGILALAMLAFYTYKEDQIHTHSDDIEYWGPATGLHPEGFDQGTVMERPEDLEPAPEAGAFSMSENLPENWRTRPRSTSLSRMWPDSTGPRKRLWRS